ncbi:MAG: SRPBCC domain-containing protein [Nanoarchaeota archaeon]|nr:SRPBCC domain-containing protein [Nanoarchaeota archaeon]
MADIIHKIRIEAPIERVFEALTTIEGLKGWWTKWSSFEEGNGEAGSVLRFGFSDDKFASKFKVTKLEENKNVEWKSADGPGEWSWAGTNIIFDLKEEVVEFYDNKKMTVIDFSHVGFKKADDFYAECNSRWGFFLLSLKDYLEKGKGMPVPDDVFM